MNRTKFAGTMARALALIMALASTGVAPAQTLASKPPQAESEAPATKGQRDGIQVHGHWNITVSDPDGKPVRHVEFENALNPTTGGLMLMALLTGGSSAGSWAIGLDGVPGYGITGVICNNPFGFINNATGPQGVYGCWLGVPGGNYTVACNDSNGCSPTLTVSSPTATSPGLTLAGQMTAEQSGTIVSVFSLLNVCGSAVTPAACATNGGSLALPPAIYQEIPASSGYTISNALTQGFAYGIPVTGTVFGAAGSCGGNGQPPCQIQVVAGQIVSASVAISFQ
jgi:hypothetical protein